MHEENSRNNSIEVAREVHYLPTTPPLVARTYTRTLETYGAVMSSSNPLMRSAADSFFIPPDGTVPVFEIFLQ